MLVLTRRARLIEIAGEVHVVLAVENIRVYPGITAPADVPRRRQRP